MALGRRQAVPRVAVAWLDCARCAVGIALKNHAAQAASPMVIPNRRHRNAPNGAAGEMDQIPVAVVAVPADG